MSTTLGRRWALLVALGGIVACSQTTVEEHVARGRSFLQQGELNSAVIEFKNALQRDARNADARFELGRTYLTLGDDQSAEKELERALDLGYSEEKVLAPLMQAKVDLGLVNEVLGKLDGRESISPELLAVKGQALLIAGDDTQARAALESAISQNQTLGRAYIGLAQLDLTAGGPDAAMQRLDQGSKADPSNRQLWLASADVQLMRDNRDGARQAFEKAAKLPGRDRLPQLGLARLLLIEERYDDARKMLSTELARDRDHPGFNYFMAVCDYHDGRYEEARSRLQLVQSKAPDYAPAMLLMGSTQFRLGSMNQASENLERYVARNAQNQAAKKLLAAAYLASGSPSNAVKALGSATDSLDDVESRRLLGSAYLATGDYFLATKQFDAALALAPRGTDTRTRLAVSLLNQGDSNAAVARLEEAVELNEASADDATLLVSTYIKQGKFDEAAKAARQFAQREPKNPQAFNLIGAVAFERGQMEPARAAFQHALDLDPKFGAAAINLAKIANANGDTAEVERIFRELLKNDANNLSALMELARLELAKSDVAAATSLLTQARAAHPTSIPPSLALARIALKSGDPKRALQLTVELVKLDANDPDVRLVAAQASIANGMMVDAGRHLDAIQAMDLNGIKDTQFLVAVASAQRQVGQFQNAQTNFGKALDRGVDNPLVRLGLAEAALQNKDPDAALQAIRGLKESGSLPAGAVSSLTGDAYVLKGQDDQAIRAYRAAVDAGQVPAIVPLAAAIGRRDGSTAELDFLRSALKDGTDYLPVRRRLAERELTAGNYDRAITEFEALRTAAGDPKILNNLAWLYSLQNDKRAIPLAREAYKGAPGDPLVADTLGWALVKIDGNVSEGIRYLEQAAGGHPPNPTILYHLAFSYAQNQQIDKAVDVLGRALALGDFPERSDAEALLAKSKAAKSAT